MISRLPAYSGERVGTRVRRDYVLLLFVGAVVLVALTVSHPFCMLARESALYLASIPFAWRSHQKYLQDDKTIAADGDGGSEDTDLDHLGDRDKHGVG